MDIAAAATLTFVRADSVNLPHLDMSMLLEFMKSSDKHNVAEIRGVKALMSSRESYVDNAVGYVEVSRSLNICIVRAKVVPKHKVTNKYYLVTAKIDESTQIILDTDCEGCAAAAGGCKHSLVLLYWLEKRSSEPSTTSTKCYWVKPHLSSASKEIEELIKIFNVKPTEMGPRDPLVLKKNIDEAKKHNGCSRAMIVQYQLSAGKVTI